MRTEAAFRGRPGRRAPGRAALRVLSPILLAVGLLALAVPAGADHHESPAGSGAEAGPADGTGAGPTADAAPEPAGPPGSAPRALFTFEIVEREPGEALTHVPADAGSVLFFTELRNLEGHTVVHRWEWNGQAMAEVPFEVGGPRWRVWSSKELKPEWLGSWKVTVVDDDGTVLAEKSLTVAEPAAPDDTPAPEEEAPPMEAPAPEGG